MEKVVFKTNIKCSACVAKVTPFLDEVAGREQWHVDLADPRRPLTVPGTVNEVAVAEALQRAGYKGDKL